MRRVNDRSLTDSQQIQRTFSELSNTETISNLAIHPLAPNLRKIGSHPTPRAKVPQGGELIATEPWNSFA